MLVATVCAVYKILRTDYICIGHIATVATHADDACVFDHVALLLLLLSLCVCMGGHPMQSFSIMHHIDARACEFYNITVPVN